MTESLLRFTTSATKCEENREQKKRDQPNEISNALNSFGHDDNKGESFDDGKHWEILSEVSKNSKERHLQNKNHTLHITG